ncbi:fimbrial protein [Xenorhabdus sp. PB62.4]|uniref:fimbrial protein n=1 Tax=Xenorhabdus sp. PB62.4 TaxID=1851573 RepID=UPI001656C6A2|nr:fimbrial protein [Xenorhabdus sp. PB62.4]MBC8953472.1 putative fimbrial subunit [Xenorhabdus sp. PB62.4]
MKIFIYPWLLLASAFFSFGKVYASCSGGDETLPQAEASIPLDAPFLSPIDELVVRDSIKTITCENLPADITDISVGIKAYGVFSGNTFKNRKIFKLGNSGLGYTVRGSHNVRENRKYVTDKEVFSGLNTRKIYSEKVQVNGFANLSLALKFDFYKIGPINPGDYTSQLLGAIVIVPNRGGKTQEFKFTASKITVKVRSCSINDSHIQVPLDTITQMQLPKVGSTAAEKAFDIPLNCDARIKVNMRLQAGSQGVYDAQKGIIKLNPDTNVASGVGIQILDGKKATPIPLGKKIKYIETTTEGPVTIPLKARYYRYGNVKAGIANATATFTMSYE